MATRVAVTEVEITAGDGPGPRLRDNSPLRSSEPISGFDNRASPRNRVEEDRLPCHRDRQPESSLH